MKPAQFDISMHERTYLADNEFNIRASSYTTLCRYLSGYAFVRSNLLTDIQLLRSRRRSSDKRFPKSLVAAVWILDTVNQVVIFYMGYRYLIYDHADILAIYEDPAKEVFLNVVISAVIQSYFVYRIRKSKSWSLIDCYSHSSFFQLFYPVSNNVWITAFCAFWILAALVLGITYCVKLCILCYESSDSSPSDADLRYMHLNPLWMNVNTKPCALVNLAVVTTGDMIIAIFLTFYLCRKRTGFRRSNDTIAKLMILALNDGALTTSTIHKWCLTVFPAYLWAIQPLRNEFVGWPTAARKAVLSSFIEDLFGFENCIGSGDGNLIRFSATPILQGHAYILLGKSTKLPNPWVILLTIVLMYYTNSFLAILKAGECFKGTVRRNMTSDELNAFIRNGIVMAASRNDTSSAPTPTAALPRLTFDGTLGVIYISAPQVFFCIHITHVGALHSKRYRRDILRVDDYSDFYISAQQQEGPKAVPDCCHHLMARTLPLLLDTAHLALICSFVYHYTVTNFANLLALLIVPPTVGIHVVLAGLSDARLYLQNLQMYVPMSSFQLSYSVLDYLLVSGENIYLTAAIIFVAFLALLGSPAMAALAIKVKYISNFIQFRWLVYCTFISGAVVDVMIASSLCFLLWRRRTGFRRTDTAINTLMIYAINTGAFTSCVSVVAVIAYATMPNNLVYLGLLMILPKLLLNSLLANLNARPTLKGHDTGDMVSINLSDFTTTNPSQPRGGSHHDSSEDEPVLRIKREVDSETYQKEDQLTP
ncbi:hypothetical protein NM688_g1428 [Phlebia brevispora]|uniref:Uncharacterized protein n=1 Tax=Phlebia brevispora TaxID=194682 RepID=A0ACC1TC68_9APHY|nr:hypothetical protein NM688_g1428 [Phlebia brevispora]